MGDVRISATDFVGRALEYTETDFGRLVLLGSLRDSQSYQAAVAELPLEREELHAIIAERHLRAFHSWESRDSAAQIEDVLRYCRTMGRTAREMIAKWIIRVDYSTLIPTEVPNEDRAMFCRNIGVALAKVYAQLA